MKKFAASFFLILSFLSCVKTSIAQPTLVLSDSKKFYTHENSFLFIEDKDSRFSSKDFGNSEFQNSFKPAEQKNFNFGLTASAIWYKFTLENVTGDKWLLQAANPTVQEVTLYVLRSTGSVDSVSLSLLHKMSERQWKNNNFLFTLPFPDSVKQTYILRITANHAMSIPPLIATEESFFVRNHYHDIWQGAYIGFILVMVLYNFFVFLSVRDRSYLYYIIYMICIGIIVSMHYSYPFDLFWPEFPVINDYYDVFTCISGVFAILFTMSFLHTQTRTPRIHKSLFIILIAFVINGIIVLMHQPLLAAKMLQIISLISSFFVLGLVIYIYAKGYKEAKFYLIAWSVLIAGVIAFVLGDAGFFDTRTMNINWLQVGSAGEALLLSFALANRINIYKKEKEDAQHETIEALTANEKLVLEQNTLLEEKVKVRTAELEAEKKKSDELLLNILPAEVANDLKQHGHSDAKSYRMITVMFTDFKDFTDISEKLTPELLVAEIDYCFSAFDNIIQKYGIEKIKTVGDAYMCAGGLPTINETHAADMINAAFEIREFMRKRKNEKQEKGEIPFEARYGIHTGPVVAGIVGIKKFSYDIWGDTVNTASRMESSGETDKINISGNTHEFVKDNFNCIYRGKIQAKHKGEIDMYFVERKNKN